MPKFTLQFLLWCVCCLISLSVAGQVTASFTASDTAGCAPLVVYFTNTSAGATSCSWNFDNGTPTSILTSPSTPFTVPGTYTVTLTAYNGTDSSTYSTVIRVYSIPTVSFGATSDTSVCPGASVAFTSTSTPGSWGALTYTWNFGDGGSSTLSSPTHSFSIPGHFNITLYATNVKGCINSSSIDDYVDIFTPAAISFSAPTQYCYPPATVSFADPTTGSPPLTYAWKYGDGLTGTGATPTHTYTASGNYTVLLKVTDGNGCVDSLTKPAYINVGTQTAAFTTSPSTVCIGPPVTFTNTSASFISSNWSFGDGGTSTATSPVHSYTAAGTYTVRLISYNGGVCYDTVTHTVTVLASPTGTFTQSPVYPCSPPIAVTFTASIPSGCTVSWLFGHRGGTGIGTPITYTFPTSNIYEVDMIITSGTGCRDTVQELDTIYNLFWTLTSSVPQNGCAPLTVDFSGFAYSVVRDTMLPVRPDSLFLTYPYPITSYSWNFGDGSPTSPLAAPTHTYTAIGSYTYTPTCTITTSNGCTATSPVTITDGVTPVASFTMTPTHVCSGGITLFGCTSTSVIDGYSWDFGDMGLGGGHGSAGRTVTHLDSIPGPHTITLTVYDNSCAGETTLSDTVDSPNAEIRYTFTCIPATTVTFTDASLGDNTHTWIFPGGVTSTLSNPVFTFPALSTYPVELTTYNIASGCRDTAIAEVNLSRPTVTFVSDTLNICLNATSTFLSTVVGSYPVLGYKWYDNGLLVDSVDANLSYHFPTRGLQTITLVIKDNRSCLDTVSRTAYINVAKPIADYSFSPGLGCAPLPVHFTDLSTDVPGAPIKKYFWSFGDGDTTTMTTPSISHTYTASATYTVEEIVTDTFQCKDTLITSTLSVNRPHASFTVPSSVCINSNVLFSNTSTGYTRVLWSFGDGTTSTVTAPIHVYTATGIYTVQLIVYSSLSCSDTLTLSGYVTALPSPVASFYMNDSFAICPPLNVTFFNTSTNASYYYWNLGDTSYSYISSPGDIYRYPGIYTIQEVAYNADGCTDTAIGHATVFGYVGAFSYSPVSGCSPLSVHFSTVLTGVMSVIWDFDDGTTLLSGSDTASHTYRAGGSYIPKLILTDTTGCASHSFGADTIKVDTVGVSFTTVPNPGCQGTPITFSNTSVSYSSTIASQTWTFAPGVTSLLANPTQSYSLSGTYPVTLSVRDANGCTGTLTKNITISPPPPGITGILSLCAGSTSALSDVGGTWSISGTAIATIGSATGIVTGVAHGTTTVTFTSSGGCSVTAIVTINPSPGAIAGVSGICSGSTATFSDTTLGGHWISSNMAVATVGSSSGIVTGVTSGTATISYSFGGSCAVTKILTVSSAPTTISGPSTVCAGTTILETDGTSGGTWSSSNTAAATFGSFGGLITGVAPGTAIITYSLGGGCFTQKSITVNAAPASITGTATVCQGLTTALSDTTTGGVWGSTVTAIATVIGTGTGAGVVTGATAGVETISYTVGGCAAIYLVTVYATPAPISGPAAVCAGSSIILTDGVSGGTWASSNTAVATIGSGSGYVAGIFPAITTGTATITYSLGGGCTATKTVSVNPIATITGITALCAGLTSSLGDAVTGGTWSSSATSIASISVTGYLTASLPGNTSITYLLPDGCTAITIVTVNLAPAPIGGTLNVCIGSSSSLVDGGGGTWSVTSTGIATIVPSSGITGGVAAGTTSVTYSLGSGCTTTSTITVNPVPSTPAGASYSVCAGATLTLTDGTTGGFWSNGGSAAIATVAPSSGIVSGVSAGTAIITFSVTATGCEAFRTVTINPLPSSIAGSLSVCTGTTGNLTDITSGGSWSSANTSVATIGAGTGTLGGVVSGTTSVSYTLLATGCTSSTTVSVTTLPSPITRTGTVCLGSSATLSDANSGGTWSSAVTAGIINIGSLSGTVSGLSLGTASVTYSLGGACVAYKTVTVNPLPLSITGAGTLCTGSLLTLSDATSGGTWSSSNTAIAVVDTGSGTVSGILAGTTTIIYTSPLGCTTTMPIIVITGIPPLTGVAHVCIGFSTTLTDAATGGTWSSSNTAVAVVSGGTVTSVAPGTAMISYTTSGCPAEVLYTVNPLPVPIIGSPNICLRLPSPFTDSSLGGLWSISSPSAATVGLASGIVTGLVTGPVTIIYTLPTGCSISSLITIDTVPPGIMGVAHICTGQITTLTDTLPGGTWSSGSPSVASVVPIGSSLSAVIYGLSDGVTNISYTQGGCPAVAAVVVNPLPLPIIGLSNMCAYGSTLPVYDSTPAGTWTSALATVSAGGVVTSYAAGMATITYTLPTGCKTIDTFTVNPLPGPISGNTSLCIGNSTTLADTSTTGGWTSSNTSVATITGSGLVGSVAPGTTTIAYSLPVTGCKETVLVTVYPHPSLIAGTPDVCIGSTSILTDTIPGGAWSSSVSAIASIGPATGVVNGVSLGTANITYTLAAGCTVNRQLTVSPLPGMYIVTGGGSYCAGGAGMHIGVSGSVTGVNYQLYHGTTLAGTVAGTGSSIDFGLQAAAGTYTVSALNAATGCSNSMSSSATITITPVVFPSLNISAAPDDTVCAGNPVLFTAVSAFGGLSPVYQWSVNGVVTGTDTSSYTYAPLNNDSVSVLFISSAPCAVPDTISKSMTVTVDSPQILIVSLTANPGTSILTGEYDTLTATVTNGSSLTYQWVVNSIPVPGATIATFSNDNFVNGDSVSCMVWSAGVCDIAGFGYAIITISNVGVKELTGGGEITLRPNPNKGEFTIKGSLGTATDEEVSLEITDMLGQVVYKDKFTARNGKINQQIVLSGTLANGVYMLNLASGNGSQVFHMVVEQ